ncbi:MAG: fibrillarin-like rRNA/tRNA 2'-O-methyltransferase [Candidatus Thorarchaeota archaeon]
MVKIEEHRLPGVFVVKDKERTSLSTKSLNPGQSIYGEKTISTESGEYRFWAHRRSKLAAAIQNGLREMPIQPGSKVLYLGAASGTTVSHVSDIVGKMGRVHAVEFSPIIARGLLDLAESRNNIIPIIEDARHPDRYTPLVIGPIDVVYQDVAQPDQARILAENLKTFCSYGAWGMVAIKARSIDSASDVSSVYRQEIAVLEKLGFEVIENVDLAPFEKDHLMVIVRVTGAIA